MIDPFTNQTDPQPNAGGPSRRRPGFVRMIARGFSGFGGYVALMLLSAALTMLAVLAVAPNGLLKASATQPEPAKAVQPEDKPAAPAEHKAGVAVRGTLDRG